MFEHAQLNGDKYRLVKSQQAYICDSILEGREPSDGVSFDKTPRRQFAVAQALLVQRYLPSESVGDQWPHDNGGLPWWEVVDHPPHAGIVASFNEAEGGTYKRVLNPEQNVVAFAEQGEAVVLDQSGYTVTREADGREIKAPSLLQLRTEYYAG